MPVPMYFSQKFHEFWISIIWSSSILCVWLHKFRCFCVVCYMNLKRRDTQGSQFRVEMRVFMREIMR